MIQRIELKNFMSHRETKIDLAEGLTALIGPNNSGKSVIVKALDILCNGARDADFVIRHGADYAEVNVTTAEGDTFSWRRGHSNPKNIWKINGDLVGKGENPPEDWNCRLRLQSVQVQPEPKEEIKYVDRVYELIPMADGVEFRTALAPNP